MPDKQSGAQALKLQLDQERLHLQELEIRVLTALGYIQMHQERAADSQKRLLEALRMCNANIDRMRTALAAQGQHIPPLVL